MSQAAINLIIIVAEFLIIIILGLGLKWLINNSIAKFKKISFLAKQKERVEQLQKILNLSINFITIVISLILIGFNVWLIYRGENIQAYHLNLINKIPPDFWRQLLIALLKSIVILILAGFGLKKIHRILQKISQLAQEFEKITANDASIEVFFKLLDTTINNTTWLLVVTWCTQFFQVPSIITTYLYIIIKVYLIITIGILIIKINNVIIDSLDALSNKYINTDNFLRFYDRLRHLISFFKRCLESIIYVGIAILVVTQIELVANFANYGSPLIRIIGIIFFSRVLIEITKLIIEEALLKHENLTELQIQRRLTIIPLMQSCLKYLIYFGAGVTILDTIKINPTPILAGAGILGLVIGLGAQNLINDMVCGFFILFENYYLVGDFIETDSASGFVEAIELRTTRIRHPSGKQYIIRNGDVTKIINYSKQYIYAVVEVGVAYDSNLDQVYRVIEQVGKNLKEQHLDVIEATRVDGLEDFRESELLIRTVTKVKPGKHLPIQRIFRQMLKSAFDQEGIKIPFPQRVITFKNQSNPENNQDLEITD